jgi:hypothetical protein
MTLLRVLLGVGAAALALGIAGALSSRPAPKRARTIAAAGAAIVAVAIIGLLAAP